MQGAKGQRRYRLYPRRQLAGERRRRTDQLAGLAVAAGNRRSGGGDQRRVWRGRHGDGDLTRRQRCDRVRATDTGELRQPSGELSAEGDNLYLETAASGQPTEGVPGEDGLGTLQDNALEGSNVDIVNEMVAMITVQRAYEMNAKMVSAADDMLQYISQTL